MTPTYPTASPTAEIRPKLIWVWVAAALMVIAFVTTMVMLFSNVAGLQTDLDAMTRIDPGQSVVIDLDEGTYSVFVEGYGEAFVPDVSVIGERGEVPVVQTDVSEEYDIGDFHAQSNSNFSISAPGSYEIVNNGSVRVAVGPSLLGKLVRAVMIPLAIGAVLGISGLVLLIVTLVRRSRAKSRLAYAPGAAAGVPNQGVPGQYPPGQYPPGQYSPGQYPPGDNPPGQYPAGPTGPGPSGGGMPPPPPPQGNWPQP